MIPLLRNLGVKFFALMLAALLWLFVSAERRERSIERAYDVPLALVGVPQDLLISSSVQESIRVRLRGPVSVLRALPIQTLEATVDLSELRPGDWKVIIRPQALNVPQGIEVVSINPANLTIRLEQKRQKLVPIRPYFVGDPPAGSVVTKIDVEPTNALVSGPASVIREFSEVVTERIILSNRGGTFSLNVGVLTDRSLVRVVDPLNARVTVTIEPVTTPIDTALTSTSTIESERIAAPAENGKKPR